jgi:UDP-GlcNAc:undecaprenyl-phosphate GlcNAc-1-phosphate transferase
MTLFLALIVSGSVLAIAFTPLVGRTALALGLVDAPGGRKVHSASVPRVGGVAVVLAAVGAIALVWSVGPQVGLELPTLLPLAAIASGAAMVFIIGLIDDVRPLPAAPKLGIQCASALVVMSSGLLIERVTLAGTTVALGLWAWPVTLLWIVGLTNAFNLIDGLDGLAAGIALIAGTTCTVILVGRGHLAEATLLAALAGAAAGFLAYNATPATIFLGDGGSLTFGFVLATTAITGWQKGATALAAGVPLLIFALPIADAAAALVRRGFSRARPGEPRLAGAVQRIIAPDRQHIHHRLIARGWSAPRVVILLCGVTLALSIAALLTARFD